MTPSVTVTTQQQANRQRNCVCICVCGVCFSFVEKEPRKEQKCLAKPVSGHFIPLSLSLSLSHTV